MALPIGYSARNALVRWLSTLVAILGIASTVGVLVVVLAMARGFQETVRTSGSPGNAIVLRGGAGSEMESSVDLDQVKIISDAPGVAHGSSDEPLASAEVVVIAPFDLRSSGTEANVQVRGVSPLALEVRSGTKMIEGRLFEPGRTELVVGRNVLATYAGFELGSQVELGGGQWTVVGVFSASGSAFDSEVWCDARVLNQVYKRPEALFQSVTVHLESPEAFQSFKDALSTDPRLTVEVEPESTYYQRQSETVTTLIRVLGSLVAAVMAIGAVFAALNTMYASVAARVREIATLRAIGFGSGSVVAAFVLESLIVALIGGAIGSLAALPFNGFTTGTMNWQTFSHLAFAFRITPGILLWGLAFAALMGLIGGLPPAIRAARLPISVALREL